MFCIRNQDISLMSKIPCLIPSVLISLRNACICHDSKAIPVLEKLCVAVGGFPLVLGGAEHAHAGLAFGAHVADDHCFEAVLAKPDKRPLLRHGKGYGLYQFKGRDAATTSNLQREVCKIDVSN
jgi:hypothetical protein